MKTALIILSVLAGLAATVAGFGFLEEPGFNEDFPGWLALSLTLFAASTFPFERYHR